MRGLDMAQGLQNVSIDILSHYVLNATAPDATSRGISMRVTNTLLPAAAPARGLPPSPWCAPPTATAQAWHVNCSNTGNFNDFRENGPMS